MMNKTFQPDGGARIQSMIRAAVEDGTRSITVTGCHEIEQTILIPSEFTVFLENCHLKMADNTFCNMFRNECCGTEKGHTKEGGDHDIVIEGRGLEFWWYNPLLE